MTDSSTHADKRSEMPFSLGKIFIWIVVGIALGAAGFFLVHYSIKDRSLNETTIVMHSNEREANDLSQEHRLDVENSTSADLNDPILEANTTQRFYAVYSYVEALSTDNLEETLNRTLDDSWIQSSRVRLALQIALLERQVFVAPRVALEFALNQKQPYQLELIEAVFTEWANMDLETSVEETINLNKTQRIIALKAIIDAQGKLPLSRIRDLGLQLDLESLAVSHYIDSLNIEYIEDPRSAWYELIAVEDVETDSGYALVRQIAHQWYQRDGIDVIQEILNSEADQIFQRDSIHLILESVAREDPARAFQYAQKIPERGAFQMFPPTLRVVSVWSETNPLAALDAVKAVEPSGMRDRLQNTAVNSWASTNPRELLANLKKIPKSSQMSAVSQSVSSMAESAPKEASDLVLKLEDPEMRFRAAESLVYSWAQNNVDATLDWVLAYPKTDPKRGRLLESILTMMVDSDPIRAIQVAAQQPIPEGHQVGMESQLLSALAFRDIKTALELLPEAREGETRTSVTRTIGVSLVANGEPEKALGLAQHLPDDAQEDFYRSISYEWAKFDAPAVLAAIKDFPTAAIRSTVASELSLLQVQNFSDEELDSLKQYIKE